MCLNCDTAHAPGARGCSEGHGSSRLEEAPGGTGGCRALVSYLGSSSANRKCGEVLDGASSYAGPGGWSEQAKAVQRSLKSSYSWQVYKSEEVGDLQLRSRSSSAGLPV